jgi:hypothetical protein
VIGAATVNFPRGVVDAPAAVRSASATSARIRFAAATNERPASVGTSSRVVRLNSLGFSDLPPKYLPEG